MKQGDKSFFYRNALVCKNKYSAMSQYLIEKLKENSFDVQVVDDKDVQIIIISQTDEEKILREAQYTNMRKVYSNGTKQEPEVFLPKEVVKHEKKRNFIYAQKDNFLPDESYDELYGNTKKNDERWGLGLFTESEMLHLEFSILCNIQIKDSEELIKIAEGTPLAKKLGDLKNVMLKEKSLYHILNKFKVIKEHFPIHISDFREKILKDTLLSFRCPYRRIRSYFNDTIAIYYAWVYHYTRFLLIPSVTVIFLSFLYHVFPDRSKLLLTLYSIILAIWTQLFVIYWNRKCSELSIEWDNFGEEYDRENQRREFKGVWRKSPITEEYEKYYPDSKRKVTYLVSFLVSLPLLLFALMVNVIFLNLSGFIEPHLNSIFEIEYLAQFSNPGRFFDGGLPNTLLGISQVIVINTINKFYRKIAEKTTNWENHRVKSNHENSLIIKRFVFEFFDCFFPLFYLAFITRNISALKSQLKSLLIANEIRRVLTETAIPNIILLFKKGSRLGVILKGGKSDSMLQGSKVDQSEILRQYRSEEHEIFDDYLEIVLEFGCMTLFAECFPFAPIFVLIVNNIEIRSDILKLSTIFKRPHYFRKRNIGSWHLIIQILSTLSIFTNMLFTFLFSSNEIGFKVYLDESNNIFHFFVMEHIVFIIIILIRISISSTSGWVKLFLARREYNMKKGKWKALCEKIVSKKNILEVVK